MENEYQTANYWLIFNWIMLPGIFITDEIKILKILTMQRERNDAHSCLEIFFRVKKGNIELDVIRKFHYDLKLPRNQQQNILLIM